MPRGPMVRAYAGSSLRSKRDVDSPAKVWQKTHEEGQQMAALQENVRQLQRQLDRLRRRGSEDETSGMAYMGEWSAATSYTEQNVVTRGSLGEFICLLAPPLATTPETGAPYWHGWSYPPPGVWA
jgi:hypothetical protein